MGYMSNLKFWQIRTEFRNSPKAFRRTPIERWRVLGNPDTSKFPGWIGLTRSQVVGRSRDQSNLAAREDESRRKLCSDWPARPPSTTKERERTVASRATPWLLAQRERTAINGSPVHCIALDADPRTAHRREGAEGIKFSTRSSPRQGNML